MNSLLFPSPRSSCLVALFLCCTFTVSSSSLAAGEKRPFCDSDGPSQELFKRRCPPQSDDLEGYAVGVKRSFPFDGRRNQIDGQHHQFHYKRTCLGSEDPNRIGLEGEAGACPMMLASTRDGSHGAYAVGNEEQREIVIVDTQMTEKLRIGPLPGFLHAFFVGETDNYLVVVTECQVAVWGGESQQPLYVMSLVKHHGVPASRAFYDANYPNVFVTIHEVSQSIIFRVWNWDPNEGTIKPSGLSNVDGFNRRFEKMSFQGENMIVHLREGGGERLTTYSWPMLTTPNPAY